MKCKVKCLKHLIGVYPELQSEVGKVYEAEYFQCRQNVSETAVIDIGGKKILMRRGEFEIVEDTDGV